MKQRLLQLNLFLSVGGRVPFTFVCLSLGGLTMPVEGPCLTRSHCERITLSADPESERRARSGSEVEQRRDQNLKHNQNDNAQTWLTHAPGHGALRRRWISQSRRHGNIYYPGCRFFGSAGPRPTLATLVRRARAPSAVRYRTSKNLYPMILLRIVRISGVAVENVHFRPDGTEFYT
ncbi:hypothetical protein EVAR_57888_1 [Eumeta japonica]|uniref:Uncharacterized protein n=1 Tax=Eumeta variegata TaxID=151549 RepID=A0A4C1YX15_EUMVA|nr:hypothetical protein EVAR_57888_1 [Eumeta japonica]